VWRRIRRGGGGAGSDSGSSGEHVMAAA